MNKTIREDSDCVYWINDSTARPTHAGLAHRVMENDEFEVILEYTRNCM